MVDRPRVRPTSESVIEHHEIAMYEWLMREAEAMENQEAVRLLEENLEQEKHTLKEVRQTMRTVTRDSTAKAA